MDATHMDTSAVEAAEDISISEKISRDGYKDRFSIPMHDFYPYSITDTLNTQLWFTRSSRVLDIVYEELK